MIKDYSLRALKKAINHALSLDESTPAKLAALEGKLLELVIAPLESHFFIGFEQQQICLYSHHQGPVDTVIHSNPIGLIRLSLLPASKVRSLFNDTIQISGDVSLGLQVKALFDELDIDWEGHLAYFTGDVVAHQLGSWFRQGLNFKKRLSHSMNSNLTEYLQEELRLLPSSEELNDFFNDVDQLSLDVERLEAHINQLLL